MVQFDWQGWWVANQAIETANPRDCHDWLTAWAVKQYRADEAERLAVPELVGDLKDRLL
jgi:hypothetical protein